MTKLEDTTEAGPAAACTGRTPWINKLLVAAALLIAAVLSYAMFGDRLSLDALAESESRLRASVRDQPVITFGVAFLIYVLYVGLSLPGASVLTPLVGWLFGFWRGVLFASLAATAGATLAFLLSRYLLRDVVQQRWGARLQTVHDALQREGAYYLLTLRLVPAFPFFVINLLMGLTKMRTWTYWWVSQLGMLPGTCAFVYAGTTVPTLQELSNSTRSIWNWQLVTALTLLGLLPLGLRYLLKRGRGAPPEGSI